MLAKSHKIYDYTLKKKLLNLLFFKNPFTTVIESSKKVLIGKWNGENFCISGIDKFRKTSSKKYSKITYLFILNIEIVY